MDGNQLNIQEEKLSASKKRVLKLIAIFSSISITLFLILAFSVPFQDSIYELLFPREQSGAATDPTMSLFLDNQSSDQASVLVSVDPAGIEVTGVDVSLNFDTSKVRLTSVTPQSGHTLTQFAPINANDAFDAQRVISDANSTGTILFGAIAYDLNSGTVGTPMNTSFTLATLTFSLLTTSGTTNININHTPDAENDSNLIVLSTSNDSLVSNNNLTLSLSGEVTPTPPANPNCDGDFNQDNKIDVFDLGMFSGCYGKSITDTSISYIGSCDLVVDDSNSVNVFDLGRFANFYGSTCIPVVN